MQSRQLAIGRILLLVLAASANSATACQNTAPPYGVSPPVRGIAWYLVPEPSDGATATGQSPLRISMRPEAEISTETLRESFRAAAAALPEQTVLVTWPEGEVVPTAVTLGGVTFLTK